MDITIRKALPEDAYDYTALHMCCWRDAYTGIIPGAFLDGRAAELEQRAEQCRLSLEAPGDCGFYCAVYNGGMIGRLIFAKSQDGDKPDAGDIVALYLRKEYWGKGFGRRMMDFAVSELKRIEFQEAIIWVLDENSRARRFYERYGFTLDGARKDIQLGKPLTCVRYALNLDSL